MFLPFFSRGCTSVIVYPFGGFSLSHGLVFIIFSLVPGSCNNPPATLSVLISVPKALVIISMGRGSISTFMASALWLIMVVLVKHSLFDVCKRKAAFFWLLSIKKNLFFGRVMASGIPGKPPPLPRSTMLFVR